MKKVKRNKKGFTLIELLAVIIILGVLLLIAVPSIQRYINSSRNNTYASNLLTYVDAVRTSVSIGLDEDYNMNNIDILYVDLKYIDLAKGSNTSSPFGNYKEGYSYVKVEKQSNGTYKYYVQALDDTDRGVAETEVEKSATRSDLNIVTRTDSEAAGNYFQKIISTGSYVSSAKIRYCHNDGSNNTITNGAAVQENDSDKVVVLDSIAINSTYFDTGITLTSEDSKVTYQMSFATAATSGSALPTSMQTLFGAGGYSTDTNLNTYKPYAILYGIYRNNTDSTFRTYLSMADYLATSYIASISDVRFGVRSNVSVIVQEGQMQHTYNDGVNTIERTVTGNTISLEDINTTSKIYLFALHRYDGTTDNYAYTFAGTFYSASITIDGTVYNYLPCSKNSTTGICVVSGNTTTFRELKTRYNTAI